MVSGHLDRRTVPDVRLALLDLIDGGAGALHLDLGECTVGDSTALGLFVECLRRCVRRGRSLHVVAADGRTQRLLRRARLGRLLRLLDPVVSAAGPSLTSGARVPALDVAGVGTLTA